MRVDIIRFIFFWIWNIFGADAILISVWWEWQINLLDFQKKTKQKRRLCQDLDFEIKIIKKQLKQKPKPKE